MVGMLAGNGHAVLVNVGKVSRGMPFAARRKIVHSNFGLNFVLTFRAKAFCVALYVAFLTLSVVNMKNVLRS
jgi:hypothetical protein